MSRVLVWSLIGAVFGDGLAALIAAYDEAEAQMAIAVDLPLTEEVRGQLAILGWSDPKLTSATSRLPVGHQAGRCI